MQIEFDPVKDLANLAKHGVSLVLAESLDWDSLLAMPDERGNYGEARMIGFATQGTRLYCVVLTDRVLSDHTVNNHTQIRRIISLRKADDREVRRYVANI